MGRKKKGKSQAVSSSETQSEAGSVVSQVSELSLESSQEGGGDHMPAKRRGSKQSEQQGRQQEQVGPGGHGDQAPRSSGVGQQQAVGPVPVQSAWGGRGAAQQQGGRGAGQQPPPGYSEPQPGGHQQGGRGSRLQQGGRGAPQQQGGVQQPGAPGGPQQQQGAPGESQQQQTVQQGAPGGRRKQKGGAGGAQQQQGGPGGPQQPQQQQGGPGGPQQPQGGPGGPQQQQGAPGEPQQQQGAPGGRSKQKGGAGGGQQHQGGPGGPQQQQGGPGGPQQPQQQQGGAGGPQQPQPQQQQGAPGEPQQQQQGAPGGRRKQKGGAGVAQQQQGGPGGPPQHPAGPGEPQQQQGGPGGPQQQQGGPGRPQQQQGGPGGPHQPQGGPGGPQQQQGGPGRPQQQQGGPGRPQQQQGGPGRPQQQQGPGVPQLQQPGPGGPPQQAGPGGPQSQELALVGQKQRESPDKSISPNGKVVTLETRAGGRTGRLIKLLTNHFEIKLGKVKKVYHYDVAISPDKPKKLMTEIFELFRRKHLANYSPAIDSAARNMYSPFILLDEVIDKVILAEANSKDREFQIKVKRVAELDLSNIEKFYAQARTGKINMKIPLTELMCLDIILRTAPSLRCITVGRSFFTPPQSAIIELGDGMEMYRGIFQSAILGWKPFLNVDIANKAFPKAMQVIDLIKSLYGDTTKKLDHYQVEELGKHLRTLRISYLIPKNEASRRNYSVNGLVSTPAEYKFGDPGAEMTISHYFKTKKNFTLAYPNMPCLWVGSLQRKDKILLPCELCTILKGNVVNRKLTENQTRAMVKMCATNTDVRKNAIMDSVRKCNYNADATVKEFDLRINPEFEPVDARVLIPPELDYSGKRAHVSKGVWRTEAFKTAMKLERWTILNLDQRCRNEEVDRFAKMIKQKANVLGMQALDAQTPFVTIRPRYGKELQELKEFFETKKGKLQLIFVIISNQDKIYNYVKQAAELKVGCLTQCIKSMTIQRRLDDSTVTNILLKVNAKLNGLNCSLARRPPVMDKPTMIMGADVTHPSPDARDIPSVAAVTASHDPLAFKYNICWRLQDPKQEIITDLEAITREQLMYFYKQTRVKPERIIVFRDGVSDGQFREVKNMEITAMRRACVGLEPNYNPSIVFVVVQKRHHTRFFPVNSRDSEDRNNNVPAGTCVDQKITHPTDQNFYLVSHASIQGVAKPTKYVTLWDDLKMSDDELENLTYHLCHLFARCTRSVSYPAPTYYAHLAAARAKVYCETQKLNMQNLGGEQQRMAIQESIVKGLPMFFV